jgi:hypothetical protein
MVSQQCSRESKQHKFAIRFYSVVKVIIIICFLNLLPKLFEQPVLLKCDTKAVLSDSIQASLYFWKGKALKKGNKKHGVRKILVGKRERRKNGHKVIHLMARHMIDIMRHAVLSRTRCHEGFVFCLKVSVWNDMEYGSMDFSFASAMP